MSNMVWRTRKNLFGGVVAEKGILREHAVENPFGPGYLMPGFMVYESHTFDNERQAKAYINKVCKK